MKKKHDEDLAAKRRAKLEGLRRDKPLVSAASGLRESDWIVVQTFYDGQVGRRFCEALSVAGIRSSIVAGGPKTAIRVKFADRTAALQVLAEHQRVDPDVARRGRNRRFDFTIFFTFLVGACGMVAIPFAPTTTTLVIVLLGCTVSGFIFGCLVDLTRPHFP